MKTPKICPYCGSAVILRDNAMINGGLSCGKRYICLCCDASVGTHRGTDEPLGTLANRLLRQRRAETHVKFDRFWKKRRMSRTAAYHWLGKKLGIPKKFAHIGYFDIQTCEETIQICVEADKASS